MQICNLDPHYAICSPESSVQAEWNMLVFLRQPDTDLDRCYRGRRGRQQEVAADAGEGGPLPAQEQVAGAVGPGEKGSSEAVAGRGGGSHRLPSWWTAGSDEALVQVKTMCGWGDKNRGGECGTYEEVIGTVSVLVHC